MKHDNLPPYLKPISMDDIRLASLTAAADGVYINPEGENLGTPDHPYHTGSPDYPGDAIAEGAQGELDNMLAKGEIVRNPNGDGYAFPESTPAVDGMLHHLHNRNSG